MSNSILDGINAAAWASFVEWAAKTPEIVNEYNAETGSEYGKPRSPIEAAIDKATGFGADEQFEFVRWVTENHWGMEHAPASFREDCQRRDAEKAAGKP